MGISESQMGQSSIMRASTRSSCYPWLASLVTAHDNGLENPIQPTPEALLELM
jgi:hypothetical protein